MRKLLIIGLLLTGCSTGIPESAYRSAYDTSMHYCTKRIVTKLTPAEYAETEQYRSKVDPDLDNKAAIQAVYARHQALEVDKCRVRASQEAQAHMNAVNKVGLPVVFVAPLY